MLKHILIFFAFTGMLGTAMAQKTTGDSVVKKTDMPDDDLDDLDELLDDLGAFLDSLMSPRSYFVANLSISKGYFNYRAGALQRRIETRTNTIYSPLLAYYHKSGWGMTATGFVINEDKNLNLYQYSLSPSYDYLSNRKLATGISYTRYFSKDSLRFYLSPLKNELSAYFTYRKAWIRPTVMVSYAWGSREELKARLAFLESLWVRRRLINIIQDNYDKSVDDISVTTSLLHDFYWLHVLTENGKVRVTPQVIFTAGTQQFGFNQRNYNYNLGRLTRADLLTSARRFNLDSKKEFKPLSVSFSLKTEYSIGKFYIQPQVLFDYYIPAETDNLATLFSLNAGISF